MLLAALRFLVCHEKLEIGLLPTIVLKVVLKVTPNGLDNIFKLRGLTQIFAGLNELVKEGHGFEDVCELDRSLALEDVQEVRQDDTLCKDALNLVQHLVALLLNLGAPLRHTAVYERHADGPDFVN